MWRCGWTVSRPRRLTRRLIAQRYCRHLPLLLPAMTVITPPTPPYNALRLRLLLPRYLYCIAATPAPCCPCNTFLGVVVAGTTLLANLARFCPRTFAFGGGSLPGGGGRVLLLDVCSPPAPYLAHCHRLPLATCRLAVNCPLLHTCAWTPCSRCPVTVERGDLVSGLPLAPLAVVTGG